MSNEHEATDNALDETAQRLARYLYDRTAASKVTARKPLLLSPPDGLDKEPVRALLDGVGTEEAHASMSRIAETEGKKDTYYYDADIMTKHYAEIDALLEDKDMLRTIATVTRSDSKLYPRPTQFSKLMDVPFRFSTDEILGVAARMTAEEEYQDIGVVTASNGKSGFFSERFMSRKYAQSLIQQIEVDDPENP